MKGNSIQLSVYESFSKKIETVDVIGVEQDNCSDEVSPLSLMLSGKNGDRDIG